jgi:outer membrane protein
LSTNVPLFTGFQIPNQYELNKLNLKAAIEDLNKAKDDIALNVASVYVQALFNRELSKVADNQVSLSGEQLNRMLQLFALGKASSVQVAEAKARLAQDELSAVQADNNYRLALLDLSQLLELPSPEGFTLALPDAELEFAPLIAPDVVYEQAVLSKPAILAAQYRLEGSEKSIRIAQSGYYPQLSFSAGLSTSFYTMNGQSSSSFSSQMENNLNRYLGFNLSVPIFNRFSVHNRVRLAHLQQTQLSLQMDNIKKTLYKEIQQAWYSALAAESKYKSSSAAVAANEEIFHLTSEKFENGKATSIEYNEVKFNLMRAQSDRIQAKYEYLFRTKVLDFYKGIPIQ